MKKGVLIAVFLSLCALCVAGPTGQGSVPAPFKMQLGKGAPTGTCWVLGDPHYRTFDGRYFTLQGNCTYTMARNCHAQAQHTAFEVQVRNERQAEPLVTFVESVTVKVYGHNINIVRSEYGFVRVDQTRWRLPVALEMGKVRLSYSGLMVVLETDFGLRVQYNWGQYLTVSLPQSFMGKVCGLCGNFNGDAQDEFASPAGIAMGSVVELGRSWRVLGADVGGHCQDECTGRCAKCQRDNLLGAGVKEEETTYCHALTQLFAKPLRQCNVVIEPAVYMGNCLLDVCMGKSMKKFLCDSLQAYTDACQQAGLQVLDWRKTVGCSIPECPKNSHYELCGNACPATCGDPEAPRHCRASCVETCTCDTGFVRSGDECIPQAQCGCYHSATGSYVPPGTSFWADDNCSQRCTCNPYSREILCEAAGCPYGKLCEVVHGVRGCVPNSFGTCMVSGDPHYITFDGVKFEFQGTCVYQMAKVCSEAGDLERFEVRVQNEARGQRDSSSAKLVDVRVYDYSIVISKEHKGRVMVDREFINLPVRLANNSIFIYQSGWFAVVLADFGLRVSYDWEDTVFVHVASSYSGAVCGLCGNLNYKQDDDMTMSDGKKASSSTQLGQSWRVAKIPGCVDGCKGGPCPNCDVTEKEKYENDKFCGRIRDPNGPFKKCHPHVEPEKYFESCLYDLCLQHGQRRALCDSLKAYTAACQREGAEVLPWRSEEFCDVQCPAHSHYELCGSGCPASCSQLLAPSRCRALCHEGCSCDQGFILSGDKCVPVEHCGCIHGNKYYKNGQVFYPNGQCEEECVCNGTVECKKFTCGPHEKCEVKNGVRACQPIGSAVCTISGDPHYRTFDNATYTFQGTCTYTASQACHLEGTHLQPFSVVVENEPWYGELRDPKVSVAKAVVVDVYGQRLVLRKNQLGQILVNEVLDNVPLSLNEGQIQVYVSGTNVVIVTDFGLKVTYDLVYHVTITVPANYHDKTCGLCGNLNGNKDDEFQLPGGKQAKDVREFGAAWKDTVHGVVCDDGCTGDICPKCPENKKRIFESDCSIIRNPRGPLAACLSVIDPEPYFRDCVFDVCMSEGDRHMLCHSVAAYVADCQDFGVTIKDWRSSSFCPLRCPLNSHYQVCDQTCTKPCPGLSDVTNCPSSCAESCTCDPGHFFNGTGCVKQEECPCFFEGHTYKIGEAVLSEDCSERYICQTSGVVKQERSNCGHEEICMVKHGVRGCYRHQCFIQATGTFSLFDGSRASVNGKGAYEMVQLCDAGHQTHWFRVLVSFQPCGSDGQNQNCVVAVNIYFSDLLITVNSKQTALVNGKHITLPSSLPHEVSVRMVGDTVVVEKSSVIQVSFTASWNVEITVDQSLVGQLCGACVKLGTHEVRLTGRKDQSATGE